MATSPSAADEPSSPSDRRLLHRLLGLKKEESASPAAAADRNPLIEPNKKKGGLAVALRGLGCASVSSSQAYAPAAAAVRSSADWQGGGGGGGGGKRPPARRRRVKAKKKERRGGQPGAPSSSAADVWCAPGIGFAGGDPSVDCVVERHQMVGRGVERTARERAYSGRRGSSHEHMSTIMDTLSSIEAPLLGSDLMPPPPHFHHLRGYHRSPGGLEEIMMFQTRILLGGMDVYDRYRDLRLDVDNMSYEELLELGERIGHVSTGLREDEISRSVRKVKHTIFDASPLSCFSTEIERKCSICQEEYEVNDEMGKLECGHGYHPHCIKQWLLQKNACPVCKTSVAKT